MNAVKRKTLSQVNPRTRFKPRNSVCQNIKSDNHIKDDGKQRWSKGYRKPKNQLKSDKEETFRLPPGNHQKVKNQPQDVFNLRSNLSKSNEPINLNNLKNKIRYKLSTILAPVPQTNTKPIH